MNTKIRMHITGKRVMAIMALVALIGLASSGMIDELRLVAG